MTEPAKHPFRASCAKVAAHKGRNGLTVELRKKGVEMEPLSSKRINNTLLVAAAIGCVVVLTMGWFAPPQEEWVWHEEMGHLDDAYISYRYAWNLVQGNGLAYNKGERVEGITNILWTVLVAFGMWATGFDAPYVTEIMAVVTSLAVAAVLWALIRRQTNDWALASIGVAAFFASVPVAVWFLSGLETPMWVLFVLLTVYCGLTERMGLAAVSAGLCFWTRPDGGIIGVALLIPFVWEHRKGIFNKKVLVPVFIWVGMVGALTAFRLYYYGSIVPNTFHAKVGGIPISRGFLYLLVDFLFSDGAAVFLVTGSLALLAKSLRVAALYVGITAVYVVGVGGDVFDHSRFLIPTMAFLIVNAMEYLRRKFPGMERGMGAVTLVVFVAIWGNVPYLYESEDYREAKKGCRMFEYCARIDHKHYKPGTTVACIAIGAFGYMNPEVRVVDLVGLVTPEVAARKGQKGTKILPGHHCSNPEFVLSRNPDEIRLPPVDREPLPCVVEMLEYPPFKERYVERPDLPGRWVPREL